uniref:Uncharacterized protein n=1 Tax=Photinus pyralis TaxID=7054 RepID=A0A1Y1KR44_PHOPY
MLHSSCGSPSCVFICALRLHARANFLLQRSQACGLSPVCRKRWFFKFVCLEKPLEHMWHLNGQDPEWTYMCERRSPGVGNDLLQRLHLCGLSFICVIRW